MNSYLKLSGIANSILLALYQMYGVFNGTFTGLWIVLAVLVSMFSVHQAYLFFRSISVQKEVSKEIDDTIELIRNDRSQGQFNAKQARSISNLASAKNKLNS